MNYIIKLEARGSKGKQEVLEALRRLPYGSMDQKVVVSTVVDGIIVKEENTFLFTPTHLNNRKEGTGRTNHYDIRKLTYYNNCYKLRV